MVQGEYWWARARGRIAEGESVRVAGIDGMTLEVEPCLDKSMIPRQVPPSPRRTPIFNA